MIVNPDGSIFMMTLFEVDKLVVNSECGNPQADARVHCYNSRADLINSVLDHIDWYDVSAMCDFSLYSKTFNEIEDWLAQGDKTPEGAVHEAT
jgi:hypothetical protein